MSSKLGIFYAIIILATIVFLSTNQRFVQYSTTTTPERNFKDEFLRSGSSTTTPPPPRTTNTPPLPPRTTTTVTNNNQDKCHNSSKPKPFNPFTDITFTLPTPKNTPHYSSVHCVSTGGRAHKFQYNESSLSYVPRTCRFTNLYYQPHTQTFHYHPSPKESKLWSILRKEKNGTSFENYKRSITTSMGTIPQNFLYEDKENQTQNIHKMQKWIPILHMGDTESEPPPSPTTYSIAGPSNLVFLLYRPFYGYNFGHLIWDDLLSLFAMMDIMGMTGLGTTANNETRNTQSYTPIPFHVELDTIDHWRRCNVGHSWNGIKCATMFRKVFPSLFGYQTHSSGDILRTKNWLLGSNAIGQNLPPNPTIKEEIQPLNEMISNTTYVLLPNVLVGNGRHGQFSCEDDCAIGRASQYVSFRNYLIRNAFGPKCAETLVNKRPKGFITFSLPGKSSRPFKVERFDKLIRLSKRKYGEDVVKAIDMATLTLREQILVTMDTVLFVTNHGGGSATSIFLPRGAGVLNFHHLHKLKWKVERFDHAFMESAGYIRPTWIPVEDRKNVGKLMAIMDVELEKSAVWWPGLPVFDRGGD